MILSDRDIKSRLGVGLTIGKNEEGVGENLDFDQIQPASVDLRLGYSFLVPKPDSVTHLDLKEGVPDDYYQEVSLTSNMDCFVLHPNEFVLGTTLEWVELPNDIAAHIDGRSSIGRLGISCHITAGFIDPGFKGQITLEICNFGKVAVKLYPWFRVCQLVLSRMSSPVLKPYSGRYQGQIGAVGSRV